MSTRLRYQTYWIATSTSILNTQPLWVIWLMQGLIAVELYLPACWSFPSEITGCGAGAHKNTELVFDVFVTIHTDLNRIQIFHTNRGSKFNNQVFPEVLDAFHISRSLSLKSCSYDNAVTESTLKIFKSEFIVGRNFESLVKSKRGLAEYIYIYSFNNFCIYSSLGYLSSKEFKDTRTTCLLYSLSCCRYNHKDICTFICWF